MKRRRSPDKGEARGPPAYFSFWYSVSSAFPWAGTSLISGLFLRFVLALSVVNISPFDCFKQLLKHGLAFALESTSHQNGLCDAASDLLWPVFCAF